MPRTPITSPFTAGFSTQRTVYNSLAYLIGYAWTMSVINQLTSSLRDVYFITNHIKALEYKCIYKICHYIMYILGRPFVYMVHRCQPLRDSNREVVSQVFPGIPPQVAKIFDISTSIWCKITAPFKIIIQCTSYFSKVGLSLYLYQLKVLINSTLKILFLHINVQINSRSEGYIIILYQIIWFFFYKPSRIIQTGHCKGHQRYHGIIYTDISNQLIYIQINSTCRHTDIPPGTFQRSARPPNGSQAAAVDTVRNLLYIFTRIGKK